MLFLATITAHSATYRRAIGLMQSAWARLLPQRYSMQGRTWDVCWFERQVFLSLSQGKDEFRESTLAIANHSIKTMAIVT